MKNENSIPASTDGGWGLRPGGGTSTHPRLVDVYDDLPLWSTPFGLTLLETVRMRRGIVALDIGSVCRVLERAFVWGFASGQALLEHGFWRMGFLPSWLELVGATERAEVLGELEQRLDARARDTGGFSVTIPYA